MKTIRPNKNKIKKGKCFIDLYYDKDMDKYVRTSVFGTIEYLEPASYLEALESEEIYLKMIDDYLINSGSRIIK